MPLALTGDAPATHGHNLLPPPPCGALPPPNRPPLPAGQGLQQLIGPLRRARRLPRFQTCQEGGVSPSSASATTQRWGTPQVRA
jgi:hypothetical protein